MSDYSNNYNNVSSALKKAREVSSIVNFLRERKIDNFFVQIL